MTKADPTDIKIREYANEDLSNLDFTDDGELDPLDVHAFFQSPKAKAFQNNKLTSIWIVTYKTQLIGCFTLSMFAISNGKLSDGELVGKAKTLTSYPAVLLGQLGIDRKFRGMGIAYWTCQHFTGLIRELSAKVACRYIVLQTNKDKTGLYKKCHFELSPKSSPNDKVWMYRRLY